MGPWQFPQARCSSTKGFRPYAIPVPIDWRADPYANNSWRLWFQSLDWFFPYIHGDAEKLDDGAALLADWVAQVLYAEPALDQTWKDHALALRLDRASLLTQRYIASRRVLNRRYLYAAAQLIVTHLYALAAGCWYGPANNHGVMHDLAILTWARRYPALRDGMRMRELANRRLVDQKLRKSVTSDAIHIENSPCYHIFYLDLLNRVLRAEIDASEKPAAELVRTRDAMIEPLVQHLQPDLSVAQFGDCSNRGESKHLRDILDTTRALGLGNPAAWGPLEWVVSRGKSGLPRLWTGSTRSEATPCSGIGGTSHPARERLHTSRRAT